jgi:hypothetical protein
LNGGSNREIALKNIECIRAFDFSADALGFFVYGVKGPAVSSMMRMRCCARMK